ncbi:MAG: hypothetical protein OXB87_03940, partial [Hyphomicrobiales bacterium]|nr:hypothetical protein [Hyphomicrobiales bacterium]
DDDLYRRYLAAPVFRDGQLPTCARHAFLRDQISALAQASRAPHFLPQLQSAAFLREHVSRLAGDFLFPLLAPFPASINKRTQAWSDPQRFHVPPPHAGSAQRTPYASAPFSRPDIR